MSETKGEKEAGGISHYESKIRPLTSESLREGLDRLAERYESSLLTLYTFQNDPKIVEARKNPNSNTEQQFISAKARAEALQSALFDLNQVDLEETVAKFASRERFKRYGV